MNFSEMRAKASNIISEMLKQLDEKGEYGPQDAGQLEKCIKCVDLLELAEGRSGKSTGLENLNSGDLEAAFDAD